MADFSVSLPKDTIFITVSVTEELISDNNNTPARLNIAERINALFKERQRVEMHVAIEFGASVSPFTKITQNVRNKVVSVNGEKEEIREKIKPPPKIYFLKIYSQGW